MTDSECVHIMHSWYDSDEFFSPEVLKYNEHLVRLRDCAIWREISDALFYDPTPIKKGVTSYYGKHLEMRP